ncbi:MAG: SagB/ThcOx family dehydrogenase [bacterium]|nr:SagB/ThcOx family dehydrogenase [bacterium]
MISILMFLSSLGGLTIGGTTSNLQDIKTIKLLAPVLISDKLFMQTVKDRKSSREFSDKELSLQNLSNLLWCANGINRPESGNRTSPSARNKQDIDIYVVLKEGVYLYDAKQSELLPVISGDYRKDTGMQDFVATAPLNIVYVSDIAKFELSKEREKQVMYAGLDAGHCSENVYLYCASANLAVVVRASIDKEKIAGILKLRPEQLVVIAQTIGYPK